MVRRLTEIYDPADLVEINFGGDAWQPGQVIGLEHPGVWVLDGDGRVWFVTNGRRIRVQGMAESSSEKPA